MKKLILSAFLAFSIPAIAADYDVIALDEGTPQWLVPQVGDTYTLPRAASIDGTLTSVDGTFASSVADGATADGFVFDTSNTLSTSGAKIASFQNNGTEKAYIDKDGYVYAGGKIYPGSSATSSYVEGHANFLGLYGPSTIIRIMDSVNASYVSLGNAGLNFARNGGSPIIGFHLANTTDVSSWDVTLQAQTSYASATTNLIGGDINVAGGDGASASAGDAHGGDVVLAGGTGYGTGIDGKVIVNSTISSDVADGATAVAHTFDTENALSTSGAKIASFQNNGTEKVYISEDGTITAPVNGRLYLSDGQGGSANLYINAWNSIVLRNRGVVKWNVDTIGLTAGAADSNIRGFVPFTDMDAGTLNIDGSAARSTAVTHLTGGELNLVGGAGASASAGDAHGGDVVLSGGTGYGTGIDGKVIVNDTIYGIMSVQGGSTSQDDIGTTPEILVAWNTDGLSNGLTVSHANDYMTATVAGTYEVGGGVSFSGPVGSVVNLYVYVYDDSATSWGDSGFQTTRVLGNTDVGIAVLPNSLVYLDVDDRVALYITTDGATDDITVVEAQMIAKRISN